MTVIPAQAGIHACVGLQEAGCVDAHLRGHDVAGAGNEKPAQASCPARVFWLVGLV